MSTTWQHLLWLAGFLAVVGLGDRCAVLLVRAEQRWRDEEEQDRRADGVLQEKSVRYPGHHHLPPGGDPGRAGVECADAVGSAPPSAPSAPVDAAGRQTAAPTGLDRARGHG